LPKKVSSIKSAFLSLVPKEVLGKYYTRQGEWFAVEADMSEIPDFKDRLFEFGNSKSKFSNVNYGHLPIQDKDSNNQHADVIFRKIWYALYCNKAVRSVSIEGVD